MGLTVPDTVDLLDRLRKDGLDVPLDALTVDECAGCHRCRPSGEELTEGQKDWNRSLQVRDLTHTYGVGTPFQRSAVEHDEL